MLPVNVIGGSNDPVSPIGSAREPVRAIDRTNDPVSEIRAMCTTAPIADALCPLPYAGRASARVAKLRSGSPAKAVARAATARVVSVISATVHVYAAAIACRAWTATDALATVRGAEAVARAGRAVTRLLAAMAGTGARPVAEAVRPATATITAALPGRPIAPAVAGRAVTVELARTVGAFETTRPNADTECARVERSVVARCAISVARAARAARTLDAEREG